VTTHVLSKVCGWTNVVPCAHAFFMFYGRTDARAKLETVRTELDEALSQAREAQNKARSFERQRDDTWCEWMSFALACVQLDVACCPFVHCWPRSIP